MKTVLFACVHNAGRSQMAAAIFNALAATSRARAISAGTSPAEAIHPLVRVALREIGVDISDVRPQRLTDELASTADVLVTMGCGEACPIVPGAKRLDWELQDPKDLDLDGVRRVRERIRTHVEELIDAEGFR